MPSWATSPPIRPRPLSSDVGDTSGRVLRSARYARRLVPAGNVGFGPESMLKILFVDTWTKGIHNILPVSQELARAGAHSLLVHRGSWGSETGRPKEEVLQGLLCRDIRYYDTNMIYGVLARERPDAVVLLTTTRIEDRATILAARALGIRSFFLMHGVVLTGGQREADMKGMEELHRSLRWLRASRYLRYVLPNYIRSGFEFDHRFPLRSGPYWLIWKSFSDPARYRWSPPPSREIQCDKALVWAREYGEFYRREFGYPSEDIVVVGHPPLDPAFQLARSLPDEERSSAFLDSLHIPRDKPFCVYLAGPEVEQGVKGWSVESRSLHWQELSEICTRGGRTLVIKLHPATSTSGLDVVSNSKHIIFVTQTDMPMLVHLAESTIGLMSSTLNFAVALRKPLITPRWGICGNVPDDYVRNGASVAAENAEILQELIAHPAAALQAVSATRSSYIDRFISLSDGNAVPRIVASLLHSRNGEPTGTGMGGRGCPS